MTLEQIASGPELVIAWNERELTRGEVWTVLRARLTEQNVSTWMAALPPDLRRYVVDRAFDRLARAGEPTALRGVDLGESVALVPALRHWLYDAGELLRDPAFSMRPRVPGPSSITGQASFFQTAGRRLLRGAPPALSNSVESLR